MTKAQEMLDLAVELDGLAELLSKANTGSDAGFDRLCIRSAAALRLAAQSAGEPPTVQQPVAWRTTNDFGHWYVTQDPALADTWLKIEQFEVQPLFAALSVPPGDQAREALRPEAMQALKNYMQADDDGVMVYVSRQALDEAIAILALSSEVKKP